MNTSNYVSKLKLQAALLTFAVHSASAVITTHNNEAEFIDLLVPGYHFENFGSLPSGSTPQPVDIDESGFSYQITAESPNLWRSGPDSLLSPWLSVSYQNYSITITFNSNNVTAVGGTFFVTNLAESPIAANLTVSLDGGDPVTLTSIANGNEQPFLGFTNPDGTPFSTLTIVNTSGDAYVSFTDFYTGVAIPEPRSFAMVLGMSVLGLIFLRRRK